MSDRVGLATPFFVALEATCPNRCGLCAERPFEHATRGALEVALRAGRPTHARLVLVGPEPLVSPELDEALELAREVGYGTVELLTNGRELAPQAARLAEAGVGRVQLTLHGARAAVHDYHTGVEGSFAAADAGLRAALDARLRVDVATLVTRSSYRTLAELPTHLRARGVTQWTLVLPRAAGRAGRDFDRTLPRLGLAIPFALHAMELASKLGIDARIADAPLCLLGPHATRALPAVEVADRAYPDGCDDCAARTACAGLDPRYAARFEGDELRARPDVPGLAPSEFVRPPLEPVSVPAQVPEGPRAARRRLPVLGRAAPGAAERRGPARSGEALREILPTLFEPKEPS